jgi:hypothetical protein
MNLQTPQRSPTIARTGDNARVCPEPVNPPRHAHLHQRKRVVSRPCSRLTTRLRYPPASISPPG